MRAPIYLLFAVCILLINACRDKKSTTTEPIAGKGGSATLNIVSKHHGKNIDSIAVYIKYNTQDAATAYDDSVKAVIINSKPTASFANLKKGKYYIYGLGWDPTIISKVKGGIPYTITEEKQLDITLPVTETH
ncbi:hypothetical protein CAP35_07730 [Chitinophagaceae bacterium IBVUCB1]|nr:hypothetical protein CAP35_07730 [Chitinophagaceae bacterium IBVUCB1]